jgi:predicted nucleic acid-binding protein
MIYDLDELRGRTILVDANAILYHLQGLCPIGKEVFRQGKEGRFKLVTTTRIVDEVIHKTLLIRARNMFGWKTKTIKRLRKEPEKLRDLVSDIQNVIEFTQTIPLDVQEIRLNDLKKIPDMMGTYGLLGNDSLILIVMNRRNLKYLLSSDTDFNRVPWIERIPIGPQTLDDSRTKPLVPR